MKFVDEIQNLAGKKVLLRVDFNLPVEHGRISDDFRIKAVRPTIDFLLGAEAKVALISHITDVKSFSPIITQIEQALGLELGFAPDCAGPAVAEALAQNNLVLLDNTRRHEGEEKNDPEFAKELAVGFDFYVNDAFASSHRAHASLVAITKILDSYGGLLIKSEIENLDKAIQAPAEGKVLVLGGAKISTKLPVIKHFLDKAEKILIGGALANNFLKFKGFEIGKSLYDEKDIESLEDLDMSIPNEAETRYEPSRLRTGPRIIIPKDVITAKTIEDTESAVKKVDEVSAEDMVLDIGPETAEMYAKEIMLAKMVVWNGPMGLFENTAYAGGTEVIARAALKPEISIIGGGDTISAVSKLGLLDKFGYVSTGGGAMLKYLAGEKLPGLEALNK